MVPRYVLLTLLCTLRELVQVGGVSTKYYYRYYRYHHLPCLSSAHQGLEQSSEQRPGNEPGSFQGSQGQYYCRLGRGCGKSSPYHETGGQLNVDVVCWWWSDLESALLQMTSTGCNLAGRGQGGEKERAEPALKSTCIHSTCNRSCD